jgi:hypothetical protein
MTAPRIVLISHHRDERLWTNPEQRRRAHARVEFKRPSRTSDDTATVPRIDRDRAPLFRVVRDLLQLRVVDAFQAFDDRREMRGWSPIPDGPFSAVTVAVNRDSSSTKSP